MEGRLLTVTFYNLLFIQNYVTLYIKLNEIKKNRLKEGLLVLRLAALYEGSFFFYRLDKQVGLRK